MLRKKYKILILIDEEKIGGVRSCVFGMAKELAVRGFQVYLAAGIKKERWKQKKYRETDGFKVYYYPVDERNYYFFTFSTIKGASKLLKSLASQVKFDLIYLHLPPSAAAAFLSPDFKKIPKLLHVHGIRFREIETSIVPPKRHQILGKLRRKVQYGFKIFFEKYLQWFCLKKADLILAPSHYCRQEIVKYFKIPSQKIQVLSNSVDQRFFKPSQDRKGLKKKLKLEKNWPLLLTVSRLDRAKGLDQVIRAMPKILKKLAKAKLIMSFPLENKNDFYYKFLLSLKENLHLKNHLIFKINPKRKELLSLYQAADGFLNASLFSETFSLSLLEALSCGTPGFTTPVGGPQEILKPLNKNLILKGTGSCHLAKGMVNFFSQKSEKIDKLRRESCFYAKKFSAQRQMDKLITIFQTLVEDTKAKG